MARRRRAPQVRTEEEREARLRSILDAALAIFAERGFAAARLDDIAAQAGVAKGTLYLYFPSKDALFEGLVRSIVASPLKGLTDEIARSDAPTDALLRMVFRFFRTEVLGTERKEIIRLVIAESRRFPQLAETYRREVIARGLVLLRRIARRGLARGELASDALAAFPQLIVAPAVTALIWTSLFEAEEPLDVEAMFEAHVALLTGAGKAKP